MQHTNMWSPMPTQQAKNRSAKAMLRIFGYKRSQSNIITLQRGEMKNGWKTRDKIAVLSYFSSQSLTEKGAWLQHVWSTQYKDSFPKHTAKGYAQTSRGEAALMHHNSDGTRAL